MQAGNGSKKMQASNESQECKQLMQASKYNI